MSIIDFTSIEEVRMEGWKMYIMYDAGVGIVESGIEYTGFFLVLAFFSLSPLPLSLLRSASTHVSADV